MGQGQSDHNDNADNRTIHDQEDFARAIVEASPDILFVMNLNTREIVYTSRAIERILGYSKEQVEATPEPFLFNIMYHEDVDRISGHIEVMKKAADGEVIEVEYRLCHADGSIRWFADRNAVFKRDKHGVPLLEIGIAHDITTEKEAQTKIQSLNKTLVAKNRELESVNSELQTFNSIAVNDYQETLKTLYTNLEFIVSTEAKNLSDTAKGNVRKAQTAIQKMKLLTDDLIAFSKIPMMENVTSDVNLNEILLGVLHDMEAKAADGKISIQSEKLPVINGYPLLLSLLFYHLLDNAIKFRNTAAKPVIEIGYEIVEGGNLVGNMPADVKYHRIIFKDDGIGFDEKHAERIFAIFHRLHERSEYKGSGIGLAVSKKIMDLHHGFIVATAELGKGAAFSCFFPIE
jgi:PAS domain S-box-containing protein